MAKIIVDISNKNNIRELKKVASIIQQFTTILNELIKIDSKIAINLSRTQIIKSKDRCDNLNPLIKTYVKNLLVGYHRRFLEKLEHNKPYKNRKMSFYNNPLFYSSNEPELIKKTKNRLIRIANLGMEICGEGEFGIKGLMSGLYIEKVWSLSDKEFDEYLEWVDGLILKDEAIKRYETKDKTKCFKCKNILLESEIGYCKSCIRGTSLTD